jgi:gamma-glutamylcyclotransferase (GGCT)/AIG2-like uncharacterized protein YtfP
MTLHFSYGANMDTAGMRKRCPGAVALGVAILEGHRFLITSSGYASVLRAPGMAVHGVLWRLTPRDLAALNIFESLGSGLYRRATLPVRVSGKRVQALVYVARERGEGRPKPGYVVLVVKAARDWGLPARYVRSLQRWSPSAWRGKHPAETGAIA